MNEIFNMQALEYVATQFIYDYSPFSLQSSPHSSITTGTFGLLTDPIVGVLSILRRTSIPA